MIFLKFFRNLKHFFSKTPVGAEGENAHASSPPVNKVSKGLGKLNLGGKETRERRDRTREKKTRTEKPGHKKQTSTDSEFGSTNTKDKKYRGRPRVREGKYIILI